MPAIEGEAFVAKSRLTARRSLEAAFLPLMERAKQTGSTFRNKA